VNAFRAPPDPERAGEPACSSPSATRLNYLAFWTLSSAFTACDLPRRRHEEPYRDPPRPPYLRSSPNRRRMAPEERVTARRYNAPPVGKHAAESVEHFNFVLFDLLICSLPFVVCISIFMHMLFHIAVW
jgi:hypothetical protein